MLTAIDENNNKCISYEAEKDRDYFCPVCNDIVVLKKGKKRIHHFSHKKYSNCNYGKNESEEHLKAKIEIYKSLMSSKFCKKVDLERVLDGVRPDVSCYINNTPVAIEIQKSNIPIKTIKQRMIRYSKLGIYVIWVYPYSEFNLIQDYESGHDVIKIKDWQRYLYNIYDNIYFYSHGTIIKSFKLYDVERENSGYTYYNESADMITLGGGSRVLKTLKFIYKSFNSDLLKDFSKQENYYYKIYNV